MQRPGTGGVYDPTTGSQREQYAACPHSLSILIVSAYPDERDSTAALRAIADNLAAHPGIRVQTWFLRRMDHQQVWPGARVVDELRTWPPAAVASALGAQRVAAALRGLRLRSWLARAKPDVVILDDGLGDRLVRRWDHPLRRIVRSNPSLPADTELEPAPLTTPVDLLMLHPDSVGPQPSARMVLHSAHVGHRPRAIRAGTPEVRRATRAQLGVPSDVPLVCGWGSDGWLDGPDVFIRALWALVRRGSPAHGLWLGLGADHNELSRLRVEAERCGVGDRMHFSPDVTTEGRLCGDVILLPDRSGGRDPDEVVDALVSGSEVVTFPMLGLPDPSVAVVPPLDVEAAAESVAAAIDRRSDEERRQRQLDALSRLDLCGAAESLMGTASRPA